MENRQVVDQTPHAALTLIASRPTLFARQGSVVASWRHYRGRRLGPYYRLAYRQNGRQCSVYLGRCDQLVRRVRAELQKRQSPWRRCRALARMRTRLKASLRREKACLDVHLRKLGLYLKGFKSRGWAGKTLRTVRRSMPLTVPPSPAGRLHNSR